MSVCGSECEIPDDLVCPITQEVFQDPVMDRDGRTFERKAILIWLANKGTCPLTRRPAKPSHYIPNVKMQSMVKLWQLQHGSAATAATSNSDEPSSSSEDSDDNDEMDAFLYTFDVPESHRHEILLGSLEVSDSNNNNHRSGGGNNEQRRRRRFRLFR